jgi:hypothetical protein
MKVLLIFLPIYLLIGSCKVDNYDAPKLSLSGKIVDSKTNTLVESGGTNAGSIVKLSQDSSNQSLIFQTLPDGTFMNSKVFAGNYKYNAEGPFQMDASQPRVLQLTKNLEIEIKVIPNVRLTTALVSKSGTTATIKVTFEKVPASQKLVQLAVVWSTVKNPNMFTFVGGNVITKDVQSLDLVSGEQEFTITGIKANTLYYVRAAARTNAAGNYYNYSSHVQLQ